MKTALVPIVFAVLSTFSFSFGQEKPDSAVSLQTQALRLFIDCPGCDMDFIRREVGFVNYVRDRHEAQLHVLVTTQPTGSGGTEYTLSFIGKKEYAGMDDTLRFVSKQTDTQDVIRTGLSRALKLGLMRYVSKTPLSEKISISFQLPTQPAEVKDKWNFWIFRLRGNGFLNGEKSRNSFNFFGSVSASRVTPGLKLNFSAGGSYAEDNFKFGDVKVKSLSRSRQLQEFTTVSLTENWSYGAGFSFSSSTFSNTKLTAAFNTGLEYNLFPYSQSSRRQLRFQYLPSFNYVEYNEETIFNKNFERLLRENLAITLDVKEPWGSISTTLGGSHYFHDFSKNRLEIFGDVSLNLFKGLALNFFGNGSMVHDQLSLPQGGVSTEEVLLRRRQLATQFQYFTSFGLSYSFGSIYSNVVNPRFGN